MHRCSNILSLLLPEGYNDQTPFVQTLDIAIYRSLLIRWLNSYWVLLVQWKMIYKLDGIIQLTLITLYWISTAKAHLVIQWILIYIIDSATQLISSNKTHALSRPLNNDLTSLWWTGFRNPLNLHLFLSPPLAGR